MGCRGTSTASTASIFLHTGQMAHASVMTKATVFLW